MRKKKRKKKRVTHFLKSEPKYRCSEIFCHAKLKTFSMLPAYELPCSRQPSCADDDLTPLFFVAGFPDDQTSAWGEVLEKIKQSEKYINCKIICLCLPEFEQTNKQRKRWGYEFSEIVQRLDNTINHFVPDKTRKVELVVHDFGAWISLCYAAKHYDRIAKMAIFDVGIGMGKGLQPAYMTLIIVFLYQLWWAFAYIVSQLLSVSLGQLVFWLYVVLVPKFLQVVPLQSFHRGREDVKVHMCYVYYQFWRDILFRRSSMPKPSLPKCPVLFLVRNLIHINSIQFNSFRFYPFLLLIFSIFLFLRFSGIQYGKRKNIMFHGRSFLRQIESTPGSKHVGLDGGHWLTYGPTSEVAFQELTSFLRG